MNYAMGFITNNERYNKVIDLWTVIDNKLTAIVREQISADQQGFNPVFMMLDSGRRGDHREPDRVQPEGRHDGARILHLHARCP